MKESVLCLCQTQKKSEELKQEICNASQSSENIIYNHDKSQNLSCERALINKKNEEKKIILYIYIYNIKALIIYIYIYIS